MDSPQNQAGVGPNRPSAHWSALIFVILLGLGSFYLACAGWVIANLDKEIVTGNPQGVAASTNVVYQGIPFADIYEARRAIEQEKVNTWFGWAYSMPASLPSLITAVAFGILGGIAGVLHKGILGEPQTHQRITLKPLFGGAIGMMVLGITYVLPAALTVDNGHVRPISLAFLSLYGGAFSSHVFLWLEEKIKMVFALARRSAVQPPGGGPSGAGKDIGVA